MTPDPCCYLCRTPYGCALRHCEHHKIAQAQDDANHKARQTVRRPTEDKAIANVMRERKR